MRQLSRLHPISLCVCISHYRCLFLAPLAICFKNQKHSPVMWLLQQAWRGCRCAHNSRAATHKVGIVGVPAGVWTCAVVRQCD